ncbi:MAG: hypothetical protein ACM3SY_01395 [Candidatus Omnitrophota bacterium]
MKNVTFEIHSQINYQLIMLNYPELRSSRPWVQKGIDLLKKHAPRFVNYLSKQKTLAHLRNFKLIIKTTAENTDEQVRKTFGEWIQKEKRKRLVYIIIECILIPFTPFLAILPGPNVFFYIPALLLYYHTKSYLGLRNIVVDDLSIKIQHQP